MGQHLVRWHPTPALLPGKSHGQRSLAGYNPWGRKDLDMTHVTKHACMQDRNKTSVCRNTSWQQELFIPVLTTLNLKKLSNKGGRQICLRIVAVSKKRLHFHLSCSSIGEGNGNPLQCSCLENPRDRGAWWATIYGVTRSRTRLKWLSSSSSSKEGPGPPRKQGEPYLSYYISAQRSVHLPEKYIRDRAK